MNSHKEVSLYAKQSNRPDQRGDPAGALRPDPRRQVSITRVDTTSDLRYARVYISVLDKDQEKDVLKGLKSAGGFLRRELGRALQLRYTPELQFIADDSIQHGAHILEILRQVERQDEARDDPDAGETEE